MAKSLPVAVLCAGSALLASCSSNPGQAATAATTGTTALTSTTSTSGLSQTSITPAPTTVVPPAACLASAINVKESEQGEAGTARIQLSITNSDSSACSLGTPVIALTSPTTLTASDASAGNPPLNVPVIIRANNQPLSLVVFWQDWCGAKTGPVLMEIKWGSGQVARVNVTTQVGSVYYPPCIGASAGAVQLWVIDG